MMNRPMRLSGKLEATDICPETGSSNKCFLCDSPGDLPRESDTMSFTTFYPRGAKLFTEGQHPRGVFILCSGRAKLSIGSIKGRSLMRIAEQGEILGLSATLSGHPYEDSAEMLESGQVKFIRRENFLNFLSGNAEASLRVAKHLSRAYAAVHEQVHALALSDSAAEKLARLLLSWRQKTGRQADQVVHLKLSLTHSEIGQMIGVSRETVTRLLGDLRNRGVIQLKGTNLVINDKAALEEIVNA